jgi:hypothetical protein
MLNNFVAFMLHSFEAKFCQRDMGEYEIIGLVGAKANQHRSCLGERATGCHRGKRLKLWIY